MDQTQQHEAEAAAFFNRFTNPDEATIARLRQEAHPDGDIAAIVAEAREYDYWQRFAAARAQRFEEVQATEPGLAKRNEAARRPYVNPVDFALLPAPRIWSRSTEERYADAIQALRFWNRVSKPENQLRIALQARTAYERTMAGAARAEARRRAERRVQQVMVRRARQRIERLTARLARLERHHAAFALRVQKERERRLRIEIHPAGMTIQRALEIALTAVPPQERR